MLIRRATSADATALAEFGERAFRDAFASGNTAEDLDAYCAATYGSVQQQREIEDPAAIVLLAYREETLIAFSYLRREETQWGDIYLSRFYVDRTWHGRGVAQTLMEETETAARNLGGTQMWLTVWEHNPRGIAYYAKSGWTEVGTTPFLVGTDLQTDRIFVRAL